MRKVRIIALALTILLPNRLKLAVLRYVFRWEIDPTVTIGFTLFVNIGHICLGPHVHIGHGNVLRNLRHVEIGAHARIGQWNWISAAEAFSSTPEHQGRRTLIMGSHTAVTSRHYLDCSGGIHIGAFSIVAGVRSTLLTHQVNIELAQQTTVPITVGEYCFIGSDVRITPGSRIPDRCVIAMGAVVVGALPDTDTVYAGVPARPLKHIGEAAYFSREKGYIRP